MKKILILASLSLVLTACGKTNEVPAPAAPAAPTPMAAIISFDDAYSKVSSEYKDSQTMNSCMANSVNMCLNQAVSEKARSKNDESVCEDLSDAMSVEFCKQGIIMTKIDKGGELSLCDTLKQNKESCIMQAATNMAIRKKDIAICDQIKVPEATGSGVVAPMMTGGKENCINQAAFTIAMNTQDGKLCDKIANEQQKKMCKDSIESQKAMRANAPMPPVPAPAK